MSSTAIALSGSTSVPTRPGDVDSGSDTHSSHGFHWSVLRRGCQGEGKDRTILGEGPTWSVQDRCLYWIDIEQCRVHRYNPNAAEADRHQLVQLPDLGMIGCLALTEKPQQILLASQSGMTLFDWSTLRSYSLCGWPSDSNPVTHRFNDGIVTSAGSFLIGSLLLDEDNGKDKGTLYEYAWNTGKQQMHLATVLKNACHITNGLALDCARKKMYYLDTPLQRVDVFDYDEAKSIIHSLDQSSVATPPTESSDAASSSSSTPSRPLSTSSILSNRNVAFSVPEEHKHPDGMTMDSSDNLWIAHWNGARVTQWSEEGKLLQILHLPAEKTTAPAFGGSDLTDLFVTSASRGSDLSKDCLAGSLFVVKDAGKGKEEFVFKGDIRIEGRKYVQHELLKLES